MQPTRSCGSYTLSVPISHSLSLTEHQWGLAAAVTSQDPYSYHVLPIYETPDKLCACMNSPPSEKF